MNRGKQELLKTKLKEDRPTNKQQLKETGLKAWHEIKHFGDVHRFIQLFKTILIFKIMSCSFTFKPLEKEGSV